MGLFGGGNSSSSTSNQTDSSTEEQSAGQVATNTLVKGSDNTITLTDQGAIQAALSFAKSTSDTNQSMFDGALATVSSQNKLLADAYQKGGAPEQIQLKYAGFAVVGLAVAVAAAIAFRKA